MLAASLAISGSFSIGDRVADALDPIAVTFARFSIALLVFGAILAAKRQLRLPSSSGWLRYLAIGLSPAIFFTVMFEALQLTDAVNTSAIFTLMPVLTGIIAWVLLRQAFSLWQWLVLLVAALATVWVVFGGSLEAIAGFSIGRGEILFFAGVAVYAFYSPVIRLVHRGESMTVLTFWVLVTGLACIVAWGGGRIAATDWLALPPRVWVGLLYLGTFTTAISFFLIQYASLHLPSAKVMAYTYLIPAFVIVENALFGLGWPNLSVIAGIAVIALAMVALQRS